MNVLGYLREAKGIGEAARLYAMALEAAGVPVRTGALEAGFSPSAGGDHASVGELERSRAHPVDLVCLNAPELRRFLDGGGRLPGHGRSIGVWAWEVDLVPPEWAEIAAELDEVWVYSRYVAEILGRALPVPVVVVPLPVVAPSVEPPPADGEFTFLFMFDFHSMLARKNPLGLIEAYAAAFSSGEGAAAGGEDLQRRSARRRSGRADRGRRGPSRHRDRGPLRELGREEPDAGGMRLLRVAPSQRGLRADPGGGDGPRAAPWWRPASRATSTSCRPARAI